MTAAFFSLPSATGGLPPIGHYQLRRSLGEGGFGQVFEAWDEKLRRNVAIKRLKHDCGLQGSQDLTREARMAASLRHTAFVKIYALEEDEDSQSIVMELVPGKTLRQLLNENESSNAPGQLFSQAQVLTMAQQVAEAMREAHEANLVHGDLKPSNLMQEPSGVVRILDFGLANKADPEATASVAQLNPQGTIAYMAPERLLGAGLSAQVDIYALGVILYELASGQRPFANLSGMVLAAAQVQSSSDQWLYPSSMSPGLVQLIRAMTAREPAQRLQSMSAVLAQIQTLQAGHQPSLPPVVVAPAPPPSTSVTSFWHTARAAIGRHKHIAASALTLTLLAGGWQLWPYLADLGTVAAPFSESLEMEKGLAALEQWDRPNSLDEAIKRFTNISERSPGNAAAIAGLAIAYDLRYKTTHQDEVWLQKSIASAQQAMLLDDHLAISHIAQGIALKEQGKHEPALASLEKALELDPENAFALHSKINLLIAMRRYPDALALAQAGLQKFPDHRAFADQVGDIHSMQGEYKEAAAAFRTSVKIQPDAVFAYANLGAVLQYMGQNDEALHILQKGLQIRPSAWLYTNLGNVYFARGEYVKAVAAFEAAITPGKGDANDYLGWANLADGLLWLPGRKEDARKAYEKARRLLTPILTRKPSDQQLLSRMALYAARVGDKNQCKTLLAQALQDRTKDPALHFRAGLAYELIHERKSALEHIVIAHKDGFPLKLIEAEPDLVALRGDPQYSLLIGM